MPYILNNVNNNAAAFFRRETKHRLIKQLEKRGLYNKKKFTWDWFMNQVADKMEEGII